MLRIATIALLSVAVFATIFVAAEDRQEKYFRELQEHDPSYAKLKSGVLIKVLEKGSDENTSPLAGTSCSCLYHGTLPNYKDVSKLGNVFDSAYDRGEPISFAPNQVIRCWKEVMQLMVEGDVVQVVCPWETAYGERGMEPQIPAKSPLVFKIGIQKVQGEAKKPGSEAREAFEKAAGKKWADM